jgi:hypothetical protein
VTFALPPNTSARDAPDIAAAVAEAVAAGGRIADEPDGRALDALPARSRRCEREAVVTRKQDTASILALGADDADRAGSRRWIWCRHDPRWQPGDDQDVPDFCA